MALWPISEIGLFQQPIKTYEMRLSSLCRLTKRQSLLLLPKIPSSFGPIVSYQYQAYSNRSYTQRKAILHNDLIKILILNTLYQYFFNSYFKRTVFQPRGRVCAFQVQKIDSKSFL